MALREIAGRSEIRDLDEPEPCRWRRQPITENARSGQGCGLSRANSITHSLGYDSGHSHTNTGHGTVVTHDDSSRSYCCASRFARNRRRPYATERIVPTLRQPAHDVLDRREATSDTRRCLAPREQLTDASSARGTFPHTDSPDAPHVHIFATCARGS
jgi:hypothetical protein